MRNIITSKPLGRRNAAEHLHGMTEATHRSPLTAKPAAHSASAPVCCTFQPSMSSSHATAPGERIRTVIVDDHDDIGRLVARRIAEVIRAKAAAGGRAVL